VRTFAEGRTATELLAELEGRNVAHSLRGRIIQLARGITREDEVADEADDLVRQVIYGDDTTDGVLYLARRLGTQRHSVDQIVGTAQLVGWTKRDDTEIPTITVQLDEEFKQQDPEQRDNIVRVLWQLARNCEVVVVGSPIDLRWFSVAHDIDREAFTERWIGRRQTAATDERIQEAVEVLDRESNGAQILRQLHAGNSQQLSYQALMSVLDVSKATISNWSTRREQSLSEMGLIEIIDAGGKNHVEITPAGREAIETVDQESPRQQRLDDVFSDLLYSSDHGREVPREHGRGEEGDPRRKEAGVAPVGTMSRRQAYGATAAAVEGGISTVEYPVEKVDDYRCSRIWVDQTGSRVVTSTEYVNPMQYWVSTARSLTTDRIFEFALSPDRLNSSDHDFTALFDEHRQVLRSSRCLGYLSDHHETVEDFTDALQDARDNLEELTTKLHNGEFEDEDDFRGTITREALGLAGTMAHIMDLVDVDLVRELRVPTFSSDFDADRWDDLVRTIAIGASIQSRYGQFSAYRQLFETRDEKLKWTIFADVDAADPAGGMIGSFVLVGNFGGPSSEKRARFVEDLEHRLRHPFEIRDDAPEFAVDIPVRAFEFDREQFAFATTTMARQKNLRATREAVSMFRLFAATPYDVATALHWLEIENQKRELRISEIRYALSKLPADRLLPHCTLGARAIVKALLPAEAPLSTGDLEEAAGVARSTISRGGSAAGDRLQALGLLEDTDDGWRLPLSFHNNDERYEEILPSIIDDTDTMFVRDVFYDVAVELVDDPSRWGDPGDPVCGCWINTTADGVPDLRPLLDHWEWLGPWVGILEDVLEAESMLNSVDKSVGSETVVSFGTIPKQASIQSIN
jgi:DNA-binding MarR family transcriptional regulator